MRKTNFGGINKLIIIALYLLLAVLIIIALASTNLKTMYPNLIHVTCVSHMLARVATKVMETELLVRKLAKNVNKVFKKSEFETMLG